MGEFYAQLTELCQQHRADEMPFPILGASMLQLGVTLCRAGGLGELDIAHVCTRLLCNEQPFTEVELDALLDPIGDEPVPDTDRAPALVEP